MKLLTAKQIHEWDAYTIAHTPISSIELMERAAQACTDYIIENDFTQNPFMIFCAKGNNGGDGLAIARQLLSNGFEVNVYILEFGSPGSNDFQENLQRLHNVTANIHFIQSENFFPAINKNCVVIDALYGSGLNRPPEGMSASLISHINNSEAAVISIDVPSGMFLDESSSKSVVIKALATLTFQCLKLCFLMAENAPFFGEVKVLDIGLLSEYPDTIDAAYQTISNEKVKTIYKPRKPFSNKGTYGHALIIAGNEGKMGAALMCTHACMRAGAGLTTLNTPKAFLNAVHASLPEAMCQLREDEIDFEKINAVGIGPGSGTKEDTKKLLLEAFEKFKQPMVIDADALNVIARNKELMKQIPANSILTPHPKEFDRLFGNAKNDFERMHTAIQQAKENNIVIVLKGRYTLVTCNGETWFNATGNAGLAKGGSGDILTGIITALIAQKYEPFQAAVFGVYIHGLAADIVIENESMESLLANDVIECLGKAFKTL